MEWDKLWIINKKIIDFICLWYIVVILEGKVLFDFINGLEMFFIWVIFWYKKFEGVGKKVIVFIKRVWLDYVDVIVVF